jgi:hypothetical protein
MVINSASVSATSYDQFIIGWVIIQNGGFKRSGPVEF